MVVKSEIKHIKKLQQKKYRTQYGQFVAEGVKFVSELLGSRYSPIKIYSTEENLLQNLSCEKVLLTASDLQKISGLKSPNKTLGIFNIPQPDPLNFSDWILVLDSVKDPGNMGTIIRLCDWFGIRHMACSPDTVDCYNPKVLQATMGSIARVNIVYTPLEELLADSQSAVYGAFMDGSPVQEVMLPKSGILIMGNEAHGISDSISGLVKGRISIPQFGEKSTESLNVAMATAILLNEIRRITRK